MLVRSLLAAALAALILAGCGQDIRKRGVSPAQKAADMDRCVKRERWTYEDPTVRRRGNRMRRHAIVVPAMTVDRSCMRRRGY